MSRYTPIAPNNNKEYLEKLRLRREQAAQDGEADDIGTDLTTLEGRVTTNEGDITSLDGRVTANESDISTLQADNTGVNTGDQDAVDVPYDNSSSGLTATDVKGALDELGDIETGTFTPVFVPSSGSFDTIVYNSVTEGVFTRVGDLVTFAISIGTDELVLGTASGSLVVAGLPFAADRRWAVLPTFYYRWNFSTEPPALQCRTDGATIQIWQHTINSVGALRLMASDMTTGTAVQRNTIGLSGIYRRA